MADVGKQLLYYNGPGPKLLYKDIGDGNYALVVAAMDLGADGANPVTPDNPSPIAGPATRIVRTNPVVSPSPDYSVEDVIGGKMLLDGAARKVGTGGVLNSVLLTSKVDLPSGVGIDILLFNTDPTNSTFTDNNAFNLNVADLPFLIPGVVQLTTRIDLGVGSALVAQNLGIPVKTTTTDDLWAVAVVRSGVVNLATASDIQFVFGFIPD